ncbi:fibrous sheath-interacting protein 2 [Contarinia nasturtii]|uniref:fibrous sheath-interacting protein 2 n=1 Tax=Contarinia nasturtii TaxID=265458 RepID=UPI0012D3F644|nr:fibrous sheath-interacting protein 2 [Contarinia nasturtii]
MSKNESYSRFDILSLNFNAVKNYLRFENRTNLVVTIDGVDIPTCDPSILPWCMIFSSPYKPPLLPNKIGKSLFKQHRNGFHLNDPHMKQTRFFVDYHRLHDPALERYFNSAPVRKRLEKLGLVTQENDALCSTKEFVEYIHYLERLRAMEISKKIANLQSKHNKRAEKIKEEKREKYKQNNRSKEEKFNINKQGILEKERGKNIEAKQKWETKLKQAEERRKQLQDENIINKYIGKIEKFKKHWILRDEAQKKSIALYQAYQEEQRKNILKHKQQVEKIRERYMQ